MRYLLAVQKREIKVRYALKNYTLKT
jgi:hypothetical protein